VLRWIPAVPAPIGDARVFSTPVPQYPPPTLDGAFVGRAERTVRAEDLDRCDVQVLLELAVEQARDRRGRPGIARGDHAQLVDDAAVERALVQGSPEPLTTERRDCRP
jgi:hypothetical protein